MAKKKTARPRLGEEEAKPINLEKLNDKDRRTVGALRSLANSVADAAAEQLDPTIQIPSRSLSNVSFNTQARILQMGSKTTSRTLFNLSQAKSFMQTMLVAEGANRLIAQGKTLSIRGLYYQTKHTIKGTHEETFASQDESDPIIEDLEVVLESLREELHL